MSLECRGTHLARRGNADIFVIYQVFATLPEGMDRRPKTGSYCFASPCKGVHLDCGYRMDVVVENSVVLELKTTDRLLPIHEAQLLTYLKLAKISVGLLMNFNSATLRSGLKRLVNDFKGNQQQRR